MAKVTGLGNRPAEIAEAETAIDRLGNLSWLTGASKEERREVRKLVKVELRDFAQQFTRQAVLKLVDLMERGSSDDVKIRAADLLLQYGWGKPVQAVAGQFDGRLTISWADGAKPVTIDLPAREIE